MVQWYSAFISLFFPRCCIVCNEALAEEEEYICTRCNIKMPRTNYHRREGNTVERLFWGKIPIERATAFFFYRKGSDYRQILHALKYRGEKKLGETMGRLMASELQSSGFFEGIDLILPVPLHAKKQKLRGYNQSEWIAKGVAAVTKLPLEPQLLRRVKNTETQTRKSVVARWENVDGSFELLQPEILRGKHVLLIDDVLTTGSTTTACAEAMLKAEGIRISVLALAMAE
ncbi:MAG: ComF family protein [Mediterranea sp.]|jgi:ComF family protein|nr:ComF family protein [Mediterranea sp.]